MNRRIILLACAALAACSPPLRDADAFARERETAARVVADCDAGRVRRDCLAARKGLAESGRRERMAVYARAMREP